MSFNLKFKNEKIKIAYKNIYVFCQLLLLRNI